ncbi:MAG: SU10 major capsid protein, partial [Candidatus Thorarchaeota archaeon]
MAVTVIAGQRVSKTTTSATGINQDKRVVEMKDKIFLLEPSAAPLTLLTNKARREEVSNPEFKWLEQEHVPHKDAVNASAGYTAGDTAITVDNGAYFRANMLVQVQRTHEVMKVLSVLGNKLVTVTRSWGGTAAAALVDNDALSILGPIAEEGASPETSWSSQSVTQSNYTEIVRNPFQATGTVMASELYGGADFDVIQKLRGIEHAKYIELKLLFGEKAEVTTGTGPERSTGGILEVISTNADDYGGAFSLEELFTSAETFLRYGSNSKMLFCGAAVVSAISLAGAGRLEMVPSDQAFGIAIDRLITPHGNFMVVKHHLFDGASHQNLAIMVDLDNVGYAFLRT